jgi:hypothetical protein
MKRAPNLNFDSVIADSAQMLRFRVNKGYDWVWVTYKDDLGFVSIFSSFGNYAYCWSSRGENVTLRDFFCKANSSYLVDKFFRDCPKMKNTFDVNFAVKTLSREIKTDLKNNVIIKACAKKLFAEVSEMKESVSDRHEFNNFFSESTLLYSWNEDFYENDYGMVPSTSYLALKNEIIPMIQLNFREQLSLEKSKILVVS